MSNAVRTALFLGILTALVVAVAWLLGFDLWQGLIAAAGLAALLVLIVLTTLQVILGELVPKSVAIQYPERLALITALPMKWSADYILKPLIVVLNGSGALILRLLGVTYSGGHAHVHSPEEIIILVKESHRGGVLDAEERQMLGNLFRASTKRAEEIAIPRNRIVAVDASFQIDHTHDLNEIVNCIE